MSVSWRNVIVFLAGVLLFALAVYLAYSIGRVSAVTIVVPEWVTGLCAALVSFAFFLCIALYLWCVIAESIDFEYYKILPMWAIVTYWWLVLPISGIAVGAQIVYGSWWGTVTGLTVCAVCFCVVYLRGYQALKSNVYTSRPLVRKTRSF